MNAPVVHGGLILLGETVPKLYESKVWLYKKYVKELMTEQEIADLTGTSQATINRWLEKHKIKKRKRF